ncbi:N-acetylmuramoyl-L-alanine amidase [Alkaliphilus sp. MSJ-5]|uniref:N-acetylmuramoyl-L-alanine amidase n=1 Tax=Alkaliphilus flagellatus TaxID=2841507 RepID=A0ABS6G3A8_9FIRM|nr:N-acetylmuramoyl-L-alanine amidase [Alkaliphilus flagellatus]MBU5676959.1 N-acetylmuramoyl-L-alanine amidase [Alkaliphilus flagellatus]
MHKKPIIIIIGSYKKRAIPLCILLICILIFPMFIFNISYPVFNNTSSKTIVIDPGHGGIDGGSSHNDLLEKNINLEVSLKLKKILHDKNINVVMTRDDDTSLESKSNINASRYRRDLNARKSIIDNNNAELFVSIHVNAHPKNTKVQGVHVIHHPTSKDSEHLAKEICDSINKLVFNEFLKTEQIKAEVLTGNFYVLRESKSPGVIIEIGFITTPEDRKLIQNEDYQYKIATAIAQGIIEYIANKY